MFLLLLLACQDPFAVDRHDLVGFRIAAIEAEPADEDDLDGAWIPRIAAVVDGHPYADEQPLLSWYWLERADDLFTVDALDAPDAVGPAPTLDLDPDRPVLGLLARYGGDEQRSFLVLDEEARQPGSAGPRPEAVRARAVALPVDSLDPETSSVDARRGLATGDDAISVPTGQALRLDALGVPDSGRVRWMATAGTFLELTGASTDWLASDVYLDDGEVEDRADLTDQAVTFLALSTGSHRSRFAATDRLVTAENVAGHVFVHGRLLLGVDLDRPAFVTLRRNDDAPNGLTFVQPEEVEPEPTLESLDALDAGTGALECFEPVRGPFEVDWLLELRCPRAPMDGARVLLVPDAWRARVEAR